MTEEQLVQKFQLLKQIKPRENWVFFAKARIMVEAPKAMVGFKFAYAFSALLLVFAGAFGFAQYTFPGDALFSAPRVASISTTTETLKAMTETIKKYPSFAKQVAVQLKQNGTLAVLESNAELRESSDAMYEVLDLQMVADLEKTTLTEKQQKSLADIKILVDEKKYAEALEKILSL